MESHWTWDALGKSLPSPGAPASPKTPATDEPSPDDTPANGSRDAPPAPQSIATSILGSLGVSPEVISGMGEDALRLLDEHFREHASMRRELASLRLRSHELAMQVSVLDQRSAGLEARLKDEQREAGRLHTSLEVAVSEHRGERARALKEMNELKKKCAKLQGLDANHLATYRRLEVDYNKCRDKLAKVQSARAPVTAAEKKKTAASAWAGLKDKGGPLPPPAGVLARRATPMAEGGEAADSVAQMSERSDNAVCKLEEENRRLRAILGELSERIDHMGEGAAALEAAGKKALEAAGEDAAATEGGPEDEDGTDGGHVRPLEMPASWIEATLKGPLVAKVEDLQARLESHETKSEAKGTASSPASSPARGSAEWAELEARVLRAEALLEEQDQLMLAALFGSQPQTKPKTAPFPPTKSTPASPVSAWGGSEDSFDFEVRAEHEALARRELRIAQKENEISLAAERVDRERLRLALQEGLSGGAAGTPKRTPQRPEGSGLAALPETGALFSPQAQGGKLAGPLLAGSSPIRLPVPATPATTRVLRDLGIVVDVGSPGASPGDATNSL